MDSRSRATLSAYYATETSSLLETLRAHAVTHLVVDKRELTPAGRGADWGLTEPWASLQQQLVDETRGSQLALESLPPDWLVFDGSRYRIYVLPPATDNPTQPEDGEPRRKQVK